MSIMFFQRATYLIPICLTILLVTAWSARRSSDYRPTHILQHHHQAIHDSHFPDAFCPPDLIANDVLVVLKTTSAETRQKLPTFFRTIFRCIPNYVIYSDRDEAVNGHHIQDVLQDVSAETRSSHPDFKVYRQETFHKRRPPKVNSGQGDEGKDELDKWKFLPMMARAFEQAPEAKWFIFMEANTFLVWPNFLEYVANLDAEKPMYIASPGGDSEAEGSVSPGGEGILLSRPALAKLASHYLRHQKELEELTAVEEAGGPVVAKAMQQVGINRFTAWPHFQDQQPYALDPTKEKYGVQPYCYGTVTYHNMEIGDIEELWDYLQQWYREQGIFRHKDMFFWYIRPRMRDDPREDWDNLSSEVDMSKSYIESLSKEERERLPEELRMAHQSAQGCHDACQSQGECQQYTWGSKQTCFLSTKITYGGPVEISEKGRLYSGWITERVIHLAETMDKTCAWKSDWILP